MRAEFVRDDEKGLKRDSGDSSTTLKMYLMPLNCTLNWFKKVNCIGCILPQSTLQ